MDNTEMKKHVCSLINDDKVFIPIATEAFKAIDLDNNNCIDKETKTDTVKPYLFLKSPIIH